MKLNKKSKRNLSNSDSEEEINSDNNEQLEKLRQFELMQMQFMESSGIEVSKSYEEENSEEDINCEDEEEVEFDEELEDYSNSEDNDDEEEKEESSESNKGGPEIIQFKDISTQNNYQTGKTRFLSKNISKMEDPSKKVNTKKNRKEQLEEAEDLRNDMELNSILNDSGIIKQFVGAQLVGKDKLKFQKDQLKELGMKSGKSSKIPKNVRMRVRSDMFRKAEEEVTKAKETGMYHKSIKSQFKHHQLKAANQKSGDRGLQVQIGREKNGVLHIHKRDIEAVEKSTKKFKPNGKGGKGGSGGPAFKPNTKFKKGGDRSSKVDRMLNKFKF